MFARVLWYNHKNEVTLSLFKQKEHVFVRACDPAVREWQRSDQVDPGANVTGQIFLKSNSYS